MSTERWERTKQILEEALRLARDQRGASSLPLPRRTFST